MSMNSSTHDMYLPNRRVRKPPAPRPHDPVPPKGDKEALYAWMRRRQERNKVISITRQPAASLTLGEFAIAREGKRLADQKQPLTAEEQQRLVLCERETRQYAAHELRIAALKGKRK